MSQMRTPATALTIAGSDNSAGAGIQADLKTFSHFGVYGLTAITSVVAEVPGKVSAIQGLDVALVEEQITLSLTHFPVGAIKTGMLFSTAMVGRVVQVLQDRARDLPLVVDPVMVATSGDMLLESEAVEIYREALLPMATLVTPNLDEASVLLQREPIRNLQEMEDAGRELSTRYGTVFLMKGGHLPGGSATDLLICGSDVQRFAAPFIEGVSTHGTGCTYSAAIAGNLALGLALPAAVATAKCYISAAIEQSFRWGETMALNHFAQRRG